MSVSFDPTINVRVREQARLYNEHQSQRVEKAKPIDWTQFSTQESIESVSFPDGPSLTLPHNSPEDDATIESLYAAMAVENRATMKNAAAQLASALYNQPSVGKDGASEQQISINVAPQVGHAFEQYVLFNGEANFEQSVNGVIMLGIHELQGQLQGFAATVKKGQDDRKILRAAISEVNTTISDFNAEIAKWPEGQTKEMTWVEMDDKGNLVQKSGVLTKEQAEEVARKMKNAADSLEQTLQTSNELGEMQKLELQQMYQRYTEHVQLISNIMKMQHDTLKSIIGNLRS